MIMSAVTGASAHPSPSRPVTEVADIENLVCEGIAKESKP